MKHTDIVLISIVIGALLLVGVTFTVVLHEEKPAYRPEETPEAIAHNYLVAFKYRELSRAYEYLSPTLEGYPSSAQELIDQLSKTTPGSHRSMALFVGPASFVGEQSAVIRVSEMRFDQNTLLPELIINLSAPEIMIGKYGSQMPPRGLFSRTFEIKLERHDDSWKIIGSETYWLPCWDMVGGCD